MMEKKNSFDRGWWIKHFTSVVGLVQIKFVSLNLNTDSEFKTK